MPCLFKYFFSIPCPGCGLTRAYLAVLHGDLELAFFCHPLWWGVPLLFALIVLSQRDIRQRQTFLRASQTLVLVFLALYLLRILGFLPMLLDIWT